MALRLPASIGRVTLDRNGPGGFQPDGFHPFNELALGNGDYFGLYWPIGREASEPLVAETYHDEGSLSPAFSSLDAFLAVADVEDEQERPEYPSYEADPGSPLACYEDARKRLATQDFATATARLEQAIAVLPEYTAALALLVSQKRREGLHDEACRLAVATVSAPPVFGFDRKIEQVAVWLSRLEDGPSDLADDPVWQGRASLASIPSGGRKESEAYPVLGRAIDLYEQRGETVKALTLMQTYGDFMRSETVSLQARYGFDLKAHKDRYRELSERLPGGPRVVDGRPD